MTQKTDIDILSAAEAGRAFEAAVLQHFLDGGRKGDSAVTGYQRNDLGESDRESRNPSLVKWKSGFDKNPVIRVDIPGGERKLYALVLDEERWDGFQGQLFIGHKKGQYTKDVHLAFEGTEFTLGDFVTKLGIGGVRYNPQASHVPGFVEKTLNELKEKELDPEEMTFNLSGHSLGTWSSVRALRVLMEKGVENVNLTIFDGYAALTGLRAEAPKLAATLVISEREALERMNDKITSLVSITRFEGNNIEWPSVMTMVPGGYGKKIDTTMQQDVGKVYVSSIPVTGKGALPGTLPYHTKESWKAVSLAHSVTEIGAHIINPKNQIKLSPIQPDTDHMLSLKPEPFLTRFIHASKTGLVATVGFALASTIDAAAHMTKSAASAFTGALQSLAGDVTSPMEGQAQKTRSGGHPAHHHHPAAMEAPILPRGQFDPNPAPAHAKYSLAALQAAGTHTPHTWTDRHEPRHNNHELHVNPTITAKKFVDKLTSQPHPHHIRH